MLWYLLAAWLGSLWVKLKELPEQECKIHFAIDTLGGCIDYSFY